MVLHWSFSDSKSPQVSRALLSILAVLKNAVILMVSTRPPTSNSSRPFSNPLVTVPRAPITVGTIVTFMLFSVWEFFTQALGDGYTSVRVSKSQRSATHSQGQIQDCVYPFVRMDKFQFLPQFTVGYLPNPVVSSHAHFLRQFAAFSYYEIVRFVSITNFFLHLSHSRFDRVLIALFRAAIRRDSVSLFWLSLF